MNTFVLIVIMHTYNVSFQEFNTMAQCQYAAKLIRDSTQRVVSLQCINK
jgi:hypothetical protein